MDRHAHWDEVYRTKSPEQVSWFQAEATLSLSLIGSLGLSHEAAILDVGAGASRLVDGLLDEGFHNLSVLDVSERGLTVARQRLGERAKHVQWITGDALSVDLPAAHYDLWHDRAAFHFLTDPADRARYVAQLRRALKPGGFVVLATFAEDGPTKCSGLEVQRYAPTQLAEVLGSGFTTVESDRELHTTPTGSSQAFTYFVSRFDG